MATTEGKDEGGEAPGIGHNVVVGYTDLREILEELANMKKDVDTATARLRAHLKEILEDREWHKGGLAMIRKIHAMTETERADFLRTFEPLFECMMMHRWKPEMKDLLPDDSERERAEEQTAPAEAAE